MNEIKVKKKKGKKGKMQETPHNCNFNTFEPVVDHGRLELNCPNFRSRLWSIKHTAPKKTSMNFLNLVLLRSFNIFLNN